jgi:hypothetical protein
MPSARVFPVLSSGDLQSRTDRLAQAFDLHGICEVSIQPGVSDFGQYCPHTPRTLRAGQYVSARRKKWAPRCLVWVGCFG